MTYHTPVMMQEIITLLGIKPGDRVIDATLGGGGHARKMASMGVDVLGLDQDEDALENIAKNPIPHVQPVKGNFRNIHEISLKYGWKDVDAVLMDLGVSSHQFDDMQRGFSIRDPEARLDMRMDQAGTINAVNVINESGREQLYEILSTYGEEERAGRIADAIIRSRRIKTVATAGDLLGIIEEATGANGELRQHIAVRVFQAFRIAVNDELHALKEGIIGSGQILRIGGKLAVISYHSLEDRIVKLLFKNSGWEEITKKPVTASEAEVLENPRSRSGKLRVAQKVIEK